MELLNLVFPKPPFPPLAIMISCSDFNKSSIRVLLSSSKICVPTGTFKIKSFPVFPVFFFPFPSCPFSALKCCWNLKSIRVFKFLLAIKIIDPPFPPSPPSGPPNSINFSLRKLADPDPPSPAFTCIFIWSKNFITQQQ